MQKKTGNITRWRGAEMAAHRVASAWLLTEKRLRRESVQRPTQRERVA